MTAYIIRRVLWGIVMIILVSALTFLFFNLFPAVNPAIARAGRNANPKTIAYIAHELGTDKPIYTQFFDYMKGIVLHFNFGYSYYTSASVTSLIANRLPATLSLTIGAVVLWVVVGIPIGILSAVKRGKFVDRAAMTTALAFVSMPTFWLGLMVLFLFAQDIGKFPIFPGAGLLRRPDRRPGEMVRVTAPAVVRARGHTGRDLRATAARQPARDDGRGLHPHRPCQGRCRNAVIVAPRRPRRDHARS